MLLKKKVSMSGEWCKVGEHIKDKDIITFLDEGKMVDGEYGERLVFKVLTDYGEKNLSLNQTSVNALIDSYGEDSASWMGKKVRVN